MVLARDRAGEVFGDRLRYQNPERIRLRLRRVRTMREGPVSGLVWIELRPGERVSGEPYCVDPGL